MREDGSALYLLAGGEGDWLKNLRVQPRVTIRVGSRQTQEQPATARVVEDPHEDALARQLLLEKYSPGYSGDLSNWGRTAIPVAIELASDA
jgi:nitroimidazol reductase NimA-like FMN-containing flavoprotein (pyridoxamine 5'-phosphate oxidase superfamily)